MTLIPLANPDVKPSVAESGTVYVATDGLDTNAGTSWRTAKLTIAAAFAALPLAADGVTPTGVVEVGLGTFNVSSFKRADTSVTITNGSKTVLDASVVALDVGALVIANGVPVGAHIVSVVPGVSFQLSINAAVGSNGTLTVYRYGVAIPAGVIVRGRGSTSHPNSFFTTPTLQAATTIQDNGTGIACAFLPGDGPSPTAVRATLENVCIRGNASNYAGLYGANNFVNRVTDCSFISHGVMGIAAGGNWTGVQFENCLIARNGTVGATVPSGGFVALNNSPVGGFTFKGCLFILNFGFNAYASLNGFRSIDTQYGSAQSTAYAGSGQHFYGGSSVEGTVVFDNSWFDVCGSTTAQVTLIGTGSTAFIGCMFQGGNVSNYAVAMSSTADPPVFVSCYFYAHPTASINTPAGIQPIWMGCTTTDPQFCSPTPVVSTAAAKYFGSPNAGLSGVTVTGTPSSGQTITASSPTAASWGTPASNPRTSLWQPSDNGLVTATFDPMLATSVEGSGYGGWLAAYKVIVPTDVTVSTILWWIGIAGSGLTNCFAGLYSAANVLVAKTADQSAVWNSTGLKQMTLTAEAGQSLSLVAGTYFLARLAVGTAPQGYGPVALAQTQLANVNQATGAAVLRSAVEVGARTALPAALPSMTVHATLAWMGLK